MLWVGLLLGGFLPPAQLFSTQDESARPGLLGQRWSVYTATRVDHWVLEGMPRGQGWDRRTRELGAELGVLTAGLPPDPTTVLHLAGTKGMLLCGHLVTLVLVRAPGTDGPPQRQRAEVTC